MQGKRKLVREIEGSRNGDSTVVHGKPFDKLLIYLFSVPQKLKQLPRLAQVPDFRCGPLFQSFPVL